MNADFQNAQMTRACLTGANLQDAIFKNANMAGATLLAVQCDRADFSFANLNRAYLSCANFQNTNLSGADLISANLTHTQFTGSRVNGVEFGSNQGLILSTREELKKQGAIFVDMHEVLSRKTQRSEKRRCLEEAENDLQERVQDLEDAYDRTDESFKRLIKYISRAAERQLVDATALEKVKQEYRNIFHNKGKRLGEIETYLDDLDEETFNAEEYLTRLRGIHNEIRGLSDYRNHYSKLWSDSYKTPIHNECKVALKETSTTPKELEQSRKS